MPILEVVIAVARQVFNVDLKLSAEFRKFTVTQIHFALVTLADGAPDASP